MGQTTDILIKKKRNLEARKARLWRMARSCSEQISNLSGEIGCAVFGLPGSPLIAQIAGERRSVKILRFDDNPGGDYPLCIVEVTIAGYLREHLVTQSDLQGRVNG